MVATKILQLWKWIISVEATKTSTVHWLLYVWITLGLASVTWFELDDDLAFTKAAEDVSGLLGNFWWPLWVVVVCVCATMFFISQWMIFKSSIKRITYSGYVIVAGADIGEFFALLGFFIALYSRADLHGSGNWFRMAMAGYIITSLTVFIARDIYRLVVIEVIRVRRNGARLG